MYYDDEIQKPDLSHDSPADFVVVYDIGGGDDVFTWSTST